MKKYIFIILPLLFFNQEAISITVHYSGSKDHTIVTLKENINSTQIYVSNNKKNNFLIYKSNYLYQDGDTVGVLENIPDLIDVGFSCGKKSEDLDFCNRFFNRRTSQMSAIISNMLDNNPKQNIVAYYDQNKYLIVLTSLFEKCKQPMTFPIKLYPDTNFGIKTKFLDNGNLQLDYVDLNNKLVLKQIPIDYKKLYQRCKLKESVTPLVMLQNDSSRLPNI